MISAWHGVAEGVQASRGVWVELAGVGEEDAARADGGVDEPGSNDARTDGRRRVVAAACRHGDALREAELLGNALAKDARALGAFVDFGHPLLWDLQGVQDLTRPVAGPHVEEQGAGRVRGVRGVLAREPE